MRQCKILSSKTLIPREPLATPSSMGVRVYVGPRSKPMKGTYVESTQVRSSSPRRKGKGALQSYGIGLGMSCLTGRKYKCRKDNKLAKWLTLVDWVSLSSMQKETVPVHVGSFKREREKTSKLVYRHSLNAKKLNYNTDRGELNLGGEKKWKQANEKIVGVNSTKKRKFLAYQSVCDI